MKRAFNVFALLIVFYIVSLFVGGEIDSVLVEKDDSAAFAFDNSSDVLYFYGQGCSRCARVESFLAGMEKKYPLRFHKFDIYYNRTNLSLFEKYSSRYALPVESRTIPTVFVSGTYLVGDRQILDNFEERVKACLMQNLPANQTLKDVNQETLDREVGSSADLSFFAITLAALIDSVSPCSIAILVFLIGARVLVTNRRRRTLNVGLVFCLSIFIAYFLFGLGMLTFAQLGGFSGVFNLLVGLIALCAGVLYLKGAFWHGKHGFAMEVPHSLKPVLMRILKGVVSPLGAFAMGFVVCLFELPCTGGPYLFILGQLADSAMRLQAVSVLLYYNFIFVLPLVAISLFLYSNLVSLDAIREWSNRNNRLMKLIGGLGMMALSLFVIPVSQVLYGLQLFLSCFKLVAPVVLLAISLYSFIPFAKRNLANRSVRLRGIGAFLLSLIATTVVVVPISANLSTEHADRESWNAVDVIDSLDSLIQDALDSRKLVLLFFFLSGCGWCEKEKLVIDELEQEYVDNVVFVRVNAIEKPDYAERFEVTAYPTMIIISGESDGKYDVEKFSGFTEKKKLAEKIEHLSTGSAVSTLSFDSVTMRASSTQVQVTEVKIVKGELVGGWFQGQKEVDELGVGDVFVIEVHVRNTGDQTEHVLSLYDWDLSPQGRVEVIGTPSTCLSVRNLQPDESAVLSPFCYSKAFRAKESGSVTMNISVNDWNDNPLCEHIFSFDIVPGEGCCSFEIETDKEIYHPGDQITITVRFRVASAASDVVCGLVGGYSLSHVWIEGCDGVTYLVLWQNHPDMYNQLIDYDGKNIRLAGVSIEGYGPSGESIIGGYGTLGEISNCSECGVEFCDPSSFSVHLYRDGTPTDMTGLFVYVSKGVYQATGVAGDPGTRRIQVLVPNCPSIEKEFEVVEGAGGNCMEINTPGYYQLTGDIIDSRATCCIRITTSDVVFDGNGHTVDGVDDSQTYGVCVGTSTKLTNVTVKDVGVRDWAIGVSFTGVENGKIEDIIGTSNDYGIALHNSSSDNITNCEASSNTDGIYLLDSNNNNIMNNTASANYGGIGFIRSSNNNVINNTASGNYLGIDLCEISNNNVIEKNTARYNLQHGLYIDSQSSGNKISQNFVCSNNQTGGEYYDVYNDAANSGDENTCSTTYDWNDAGTVGCTYKCETYDVSGCMVIDSPGYYKLTGDITVTDSSQLLPDSSNTWFSCISITASDVVFDGDGHRIQGIKFQETTRTSVGVNAHANGTVKNAILTEWDVGIRGSSNGSHENNKVYNTQYGIQFEAWMDSVAITGNDVYNNGYGISLFRNTHVNITGNGVHTNYYGIHFISSSNNRIMGNDVYKNNYGIYLRGEPPNYFSNDNIIADNNVSESTGTGIHLEFSNANLIYNNFFNNTINFNVTSSSNKWNIKLPTTANELGYETNIVGGNFIGGNAWFEPNGFGHSQICIDLDKYGICDDVYQLDANNIDYWPLCGPRPNIAIKSVTAGGPYKLYVVGENEVKVIVELSNSGEVDGNAIVRLQNLPNETGKQVRLVKIPKDETVSIDFIFNISSYDWIDGWKDKGFDKGSYSFLVNASNLFGTEMYDTANGSFEVKKGPLLEARKSLGSYIDHESNENGTVEVGEYFLLWFSICNIGDEDLGYFWLQSQKSGRPPLVEGFTAYLGLHHWKVGLKVNECLETGHMDDATYRSNPNYYTKAYVAGFYQWRATAVGLAKLNFYVTYNDVKGVEHETMLVSPIDFPIYDYKGKTLKAPQVKREGEFEVTILGIEGDKVTIKIRNKGGVYYTYKINGEPTGFWDELRNFTAPGGEVEKTITTLGLATNWKFKVEYHWSYPLNTLDGLLNAISPLLPPPLDNLPLLIDILLLCAQEVKIDQKKLAEEGISVLLEELTHQESKYYQKLIEYVWLNYGKDAATQLTEKTMGKLVALPMAVYKTLQWAWNNLHCENDRYFDVTVTDPPEEYSVTAETVPPPLFFGGLTNETSNTGEGNMTITINENGEGEYNATHEIDTLYVSLNTTDFHIVPMLVISTVGKRTSSGMIGNVTIHIYLGPNSPASAYEILLADIGFVESIIESYFIRMETYESRLVGDHIELEGKGELLTSIYDDEINITIVITQKKITGNFFRKGRYTELTDSGIKADIDFGPSLNIPLNNTRLDIVVPYDVLSVTPEPDYVDPKLHWQSTPAHVTIYLPNLYVHDVVWETQSYSVLTFTNSTMQNFEFNQTLMQISFDVAGADGTDGFCKVTIPKILLQGDPWKISVNGTEVTAAKTENITHTTLYLGYAYNNTLHIVIQGTQVVSEYSPLISLCAVLICTILLLALAKRKLPKRKVTNRNETHSEYHSIARERPQ